LQKRPPDAEFYAQLQKFIADDSNSRNERGELLLNILGIPQTKESLDLLIQTATTSPDEGIRNTAISAIRSINLCKEELSPALELVWQDSHDQYLLIATAVAMAKVGAPSGIKLLLSSALATDPQSDQRKQAALNALPEARNPHAVPILTDLLANQPPTSESSKLASSILAEMVFPVAAKSLVNWLQTADASAAPLALSYAVNARTPTLLQACQAALDPSVPFRSEQNREAIRTGLAQRQAGYKNKL
jgi:HEAT repeat protein